MTVLVTGGAGYIGAHVVRLLLDRGDRVLVVDDLSTGVAANVAGAVLIEVDLSSQAATERLAALMEEHAVEAVIHIAAKKQVGESVQRPAWYYHHNVGALANLLQAMEDAGVDKMMFSSSAATYGTPEIPAGQLVTEDTPPRPISPYGETKLVCEWLMRAAGRAWGLRGVGLRYFNVAGSGWPELGDPTVLNLFPIVLHALTEGKQPVVFGDDYPTPDGTCIRDYIHVLDLAESHLLALDYLERQDRPHDLFNVGSGTGSSVQQVLRQLAASTGYDVTPKVVARRPGDPAVLVADVTRIEQTLGWVAKRTLADMADSAWQSWPLVHGDPAVPPARR